jgi:putative phosphoribosyl transferase
MVFANRNEAGVRLAAELQHYKGEDVVVFALPRGGVPVAAPVASALNAPLDLVLVRKLGAPFQPELAMGAVADAGQPVIVRNDDVIAMARVSEAEFDAACQRELLEIERRRALYFGSRPRAEAKGRVAIVIDDGIATGATARAALQAIRARQPKKLVLATPIAPPDALELLRPEADEVVGLQVQAKFGAIGFFYRDFHQLDDNEVIAILNRFKTGAAKAI